MIKAENKLNEYVTQETKQEKQQLENAIKNYQTKETFILKKYRTFNWPTRSQCNMLGYQHAP